MVINGYKKCPKCKRWYPLDLIHFYRNKNKKHGVTDHCQECCKAMQRKYREENPEKVRRYRNDYRRIRREELREYAIRYREENLEAIRERDKELRLENIDEHRKYDREYSAERRKNPKHRLNGTISMAINKCLNGGKGGHHWEELVGYTLANLTTHIEQQFTKGMSWENYGDWHIDHIRPIADFNFESPDDPEFKECWSLWNLQPLWAKENWSKHDKCEAPPLPLC